MFGVQASKCAWGIALRHERDAALDDESVCAADNSATRAEFADYGADKEGDGYRCDVVGEARDDRHCCDCFGHVARRGEYRGAIAL